MLYVAGLRTWFGVLIGPWRARAVIGVLAESSRTVVCALFVLKKIGLDIGFQEGETIS